MRVVRRLLVGVCCVSLWMMVVCVVWCVVLGFIAMCLVVGGCLFGVCCLVCVLFDGLRVVCVLCAVCCLVRVVRCVCCVWACLLSVL